MAPFFHEQMQQVYSFSFFESSCSQKCHFWMAISFIKWFNISIWSCYNYEKRISHQYQISMASFLHEPMQLVCISWFWYTANIFKVIFTVFNCVRLSTAISLYGLHFLPYTVQCRNYIKKTVNQFTIILLYLEQQLNVIHTAKLQWKVGHN